MRRVFHGIAISAAFLCYGYAAMSQEALPSANTLDNLIEILTEQSDDENIHAEWLEELQELSENPLNINRASADDLLRIPFLNEVLVNNLLVYRKRTGTIFSVYELASVEGFDRRLAGLLSWFVTVESGSEAVKDSGKWKIPARQQILMKGWQSFPDPDGYRQVNGKPPAFQGSPQKLYMRYQYRKGDLLQVGITADKDPGEEFFRRSNPLGFDFYSGHVSLKPSARMPQLVLGDFSVRAGQGLVISQGFSMGKSADVLQISKSASQVRPYTSSGENFFFRGVAGTLEAGNARIHLFGSAKRSDANLVHDSDGSTTFTSLQSSGYHRTLTEIDDKNSLRHWVTGGIFTFFAGRLRFGATLLYERFQYPFIRGNQLYQKYLFKGSENCNAGVDYRWVKGRYQFFGEGAVSRSGGLAVVQGLEARLHDQISMAMVFRHYDKNYHATWAGSFGEGSSTVNETGFYMGVKAFPVSRLTLSAYADWFRFPWISYSTSGPASGREVLVQADVRPSRKMNGYIRLKTKVRPDKSKSEHTYYDVSESRTTSRAHLVYQLSDEFSLKTRLERAGYFGLSGEKGMLIYQDLGWTPKKSSLTAALRFAWFNTGGYSSRIYTYENDLLYNFSTLAFSGKGIRTYLNLKFSFLNHFDSWLKIAYTAYSDRDTISSGHARIPGHDKTECKLQIRYRF